MRRRKFIAQFATAVVSWPLAARAQQSAMPVIGFLGGATARAYEPRLIPFRQSLKEAGFIEGENIRIEYRWSGDGYERLPALAAELIHLPATVI